MEEIKKETPAVDVLDTNYPLMVLLRTKAPGTYNHSKTVSSLLESVGTALDLSIRDLRIAGFYHDIGKTNCPEAFTENQDDDTSEFHTDKPVKDSLKYLTSHVADTVNILINDPNIPIHVTRWCSQHHGNSKLKYFYKRECQKKNELIPDAPFRYKCYRPENLESAVLMICDIVEATTRSMEQNNKLEDVEKLIDGIVAELEKDEQLDDVVLTFKKLRTIKEVLKREIASSYHKRIDYDIEDEKVEPEVKK